MKNWKSLIPLFLIIILMLAACGGQAGSGAAPVVSDPAAAAQVVEELGVDVDVDTVNEIKDRSDVYVLDVREQNEYDEKHIPGVTLLPMSEIQDRLDEIPTDKEVIVTCRTGNRSSQVTQFLQQSGFDNVHNMRGGIVAWEEAGYPVER